MMHIIEKSRTNRTWGEKEHAIMRRMHAKGSLSEEIALATGFADQTVRRKMWDEGLEPNARPDAIGVRKHEVQPRPEPEKTHPLTLAATTLGRAFDRERMRLHGTPIKFFDLMREVNKVLYADGKDQWTGDESCVIP